MSSNAPHMHSLILFDNSDIIIAHVVTVFKQREKTWVDKHVAVWFISLAGENNKKICVQALFQIY